jgi:hypothetical protein
MPFLAPKAQFGLTGDILLGEAFTTLPFSNSLCLLQFSLTLFERGFSPFVVALPTPGFQSFDLSRCSVPGVSFTTLPM